MSFRGLFSKPTSFKDLPEDTLFQIFFNAELDELMTYRVDHWTKSMIEMAILRGFLLPYIELTALLTSAEIKNHYNVMNVPIPGNVLNITGSNMINVPLIDGSSIKTFMALPAARARNIDYDKKGKIYLSEKMLASEYISDGIRNIARVKHEKEKNKIARGFMQYNGPLDICFFEGYIQSVTNLIQHGVHQESFELVGTPEIHEDTIRDLNRYQHAFLDSPLTKVRATKIAANHENTIEMWRSLIKSWWNPIVTTRFNRDPNEFCLTLARLGLTSDEAYTIYSSPEIKSSYYLNFQHHDEKRDEAAKNFALWYALAGIKPETIITQDITMQEWLLCYPSNILQWMLDSNCNLYQRHFAKLEIAKLRAIFEHKEGIVSLLKLGISFGEIATLADEHLKRICDNLRQLEKECDVTIPDLRLPPEQSLPLLKINELEDYLKNKDIIKESLKNSNITQVITNLLYKKDSRIESTEHAQPSTSRKC